jgi:zinc transporter ZupT
VSFLPGLNPLFMAFAAGAMIFVSIHELLPMACRYKRMSLFILGVVLSVIVYMGLAMLIKV